MADDFYSLADLLVVNNKALSGLVTDELLEAAPFVRALAAQPASDTTRHQWLQYTGAPVVGFRDLNAGRDHDSSIDTNVTVDCEILDASFSCDVQAARGYRYGTEAFLDREARRHMRTAFSVLEKQVIYGTGNDADGFTGMVDNAYLNGLSDDMVVGAGGSSACTSVYFVNSSRDSASLVMGNDGNITVDEPVMIRGGAADAWYGSYFVNISSYFAFQYGSKYSVGRLANLDAGSNTLDDDQIASVLDLFPSDRQPNMIVMNRRSMGQLRASRTATNPTGTPAPYPESAFGIPIILTDSISNAETTVV